MKKTVFESVNELNTEKAPESAKGVLSYFSFVSSLFRRAEVKPDIVPFDFASHLDTSFKEQLSALDPKSNKRLLHILNNGFEKDTYQRVDEVLTKRIGDNLDRFLAQNPDGNIKAYLMESIQNAALSLCWAEAIGGNQPNVLHHAFQVIKRNEGFDGPLKELNRLLSLSPSDPQMDRIVNVCESLDRMAQRSPNLIKKAIQTYPFLKDIHTEMKSATMDLDSEIESSAKMEKLKHYRYSEPKLGGAQLGLVVKRKKQSHDLPDLPKYDYQWMLKRQEPVLSVFERVATAIGRNVFGNMIPKTRLVTNENHSEIFIASRFIADFQTLADANQGMKRSNEDIYTQTPGIKKLIAFALLISNPDLHDENLGLSGKEGSRKAAQVDMGSAFDFRAGYSAHTSEMADLKKGNPVKPIDILRYLQESDYNIHSHLFLNREFVAALDDIAESFKENSKPRQYTERAIRSAVKEAQDIIGDFPDKSINKLNKEIKKALPEATINNLDSQLIQTLSERAKMIETLSVDIQVQLCVLENNERSLHKLLQSHPEALNRPVQWLSEQNGAAMPPPSTVLEYARSHHCSKSMIGMIEHFVPESELPLVGESHIPVNLKIDPTKIPSWSEKTSPKEKISKAEVRNKNSGRHL
ncbi:MAG: hypothetical protein IPP74_11470 [Alphaproteobacteria bacterium]|nr:hypothetical protein [Alphaproteobacteria bacterium]